MDLSSMRRQVLAIPVLVALSAVVIAIAPPIVSPPNAPPAPVKAAGPAPVRHPATVLDDHVLVAWYGNPWTGKMGILGRLTGDALADGLKQQAAAYAKATNKKVLPAYELIAVVAQATAGSDGLYRRREHRDVIDRMLAAARAAGFKLVLDIQTGRSSVLSELQYLAPYLEQPDVYLALDPFNQQQVALKVFNLEALHDVNRAKAFRKLLLVHASGYWTVVDWSTPDELIWKHLIRPMHSRLNH